MNGLESLLNEQVNINKVLAILDEKYFQVGKESEYARWKGNRQLTRIAAEKLVIINDLRMEISKLQKVKSGV